MTSVGTSRAGTKRGNEWSWSEVREAGRRPSKRSSQSSRGLRRPKGQQWHPAPPTNPSSFFHTKRIATESDSPADTENVPKPRDDNALPEEVMAELRVVSVRKKTAMCLVTSSRREIEAGDKAYARNGY